MKRDLMEQIEIPEGVEVTIDGTKIKIKGPEGEIEREFRMNKIDSKVENGKLILESKGASKREKKMMYTNLSHIKNMIQGVQEKFEYTLKVASSHFPMTAEVSGDKVIIKNFLGEKIPREAKIPKGAEVEVKKDIITIKSIDKELAGQAAANLENATKIRFRDRRIFQDGVYITNKAGKEI